MYAHKGASWNLGRVLLLLVALASSSIISPCDSRAQLQTGAPYNRLQVAPQGTQSAFHLQTPAQNARQLYYSSSLFRQNGRLPSGRLTDLLQTNLFQCDEPTRELFESFAHQYNRTFIDSTDKLERLNLFAVTLKRAILFNRVIQHEFLKESNYVDKPEIRNYHFVEATRGSNFALWYVDITDCELGLIKKTIFDIFYHLDANDYAEAYRLVQANRDFLPGLMTDDGFEQLVNILLVRLYDRFHGDKKMNQLFAWPVYLRKLAAYAYNRQQALQPGQRTKMALVSFAYPAFFKDLKYNLPAINRTGDNVRANQEHELFFKRLDRQFPSLSERNKRLAIFRQRWSLLNALNGQSGAAPEEELLASRGRHASQLPDWLRVQLRWDSNELPLEYNSSSIDEDSPRNARLEARAEQENSSLPVGAQNHQRPAQNFKLTEFSDLTDLEFVAFLTNDFSLLGKNSDSMDYLMRNFPVRQLDSKLRWELAHELELRRALVMTTNELQQEQNGRAAQLAANMQVDEPRPLTRAGLKLAKQVIDELISDVGLPIGPASLENISEDETYRVFERLTQVYKKSYARQVALTSGQLSSSDLADERALRYQIFKENYARFRAFMIKENWQLDEAQLLRMLRLADMSWIEIKLTMFRICCLNDVNLRALSAQNATIEYLASNADILCQQMEPQSSQVGSSSSSSRPIELQPLGSSAKLQQQQQQQQQAQDSYALELYYYYAVHFNKHHTPGNQLDFERRLATFRRNIDAIRRHSCVRSLTLYRSFQLKRPDFLSTIDVIDARRSHTDDLNLDRFDYFRLPESLELAPRPTNDLVSAPYSVVNSASSGRQTSQLEVESARAPISYRRDAYFSSLMSASGEREFQGAANSAANELATSSVLYSEKLLDSLQDSNELARQYRVNRAQLIYELVMARYKFCMKNYENIDLYGRSELRQQCQTSGPLSDGASNSLGNLVEDSQSSRSRLRLASGQSQQGDRCAYYRQGLEPWAAGLIRQDERSIELIRRASCSFA